jgi:hypothetical protein
MLKSRPFAAAFPLAALLLALPAHAQVVEPGDWRAVYGVTLLGLPIGTANLTAALDRARYKIEVQARLTGLAGMVTGGKGAGQASGSFAQGRPLSAGYSAAGSNGRESRTVQMAMANSAATAIEITPPIIKKPDAIPVLDGHKRGVTDPVSALFMPVPGGQGAASPAACNRTIPVFDGNARYDIALSYAGVREVQGSGYAGPVAVCNARFVPISGHRNNKASQFMAANRDMQVWLAPIPGTQLVAPYRISVRSEIGMVVIEASRFDGASRVAASPEATSSTRPARGTRASSQN